MSERATPEARSQQTLWERIKDWRPGTTRHASRDTIAPSRREELLAIVQATGPLRHSRVELPGTDVTLRITRPYPVITERRRLGPYWGEIWPSGVILAGVIARDPNVLYARHVLELGPGVGVTAVAALQAGADLVVADSEPGSLAFCALNALDNVGVEPKTIRVNWRKPSSELFAAAGEGFSLVLAADVLYEDEDVKPLLALLDRIVAPGGELWLAEPGRDPAEDFVKAIRKRGWRGTREDFDSPLLDPHDHGEDEVTVHRLRKPAVRR